MTFNISIIAICNPDRIIITIIIISGLHYECIATDNLKLFTKY